MEIEREETTLGTKALNISETLSLSGKAGVEFGLFSLEGEVGVGKLEAKAEIGTSTTRTSGWSTKYAFSYPLGPSQQCGIAQLTLQGFAGVNPLLLRLFDNLRTVPCGSAAEKYVKSRGRTFGREAEAEAKIDIGATRPVAGSDVVNKQLGVKFGASASGGFGLETAYKRGFALPLGAAAPTQVSSTEEYTLNGKINLSAGLQLNAADPPAKQEDDKTTIDTPERALKTSVSDKLAESYTVSFVTDFTKPIPAGGNPSSLEISFTGPKGFGWTRSLGSTSETKIIGNPTRSITWTIEDDADIAKMVAGLANLKAIRDSNVGAGLLNEITLGPTVLADELGKFRALLGEVNATYTINESIGEADEKPFGLKGKLLGLKLGAGISFKSEHKVSYVTEKGAIVKGRSYPLEQYQRDSYIPPPDLGLRDVIADAWDAVLGSMGASNLSDVVVNVIGTGLTRLQSLFTATLDIDGSREPAAFEAGLLSYRYVPIVGPVKDARMMPAAASGPAGAPHYGIGGFHQFTPEGYSLAVPTPLVIDYQDAEAAGLDESTFAIYGWNLAAKDWDYVGGAVDANANTVTVPIQTFRLYTVAPAMPARDVALSVVEQTVNGALDEQKFRFRVRSGALVLNNGQPVPDGTMFSVRSVYPAAGTVAPYGAILTADADAVRENVQVASQNGVIEFEVEFPAPNDRYMPGRVVIYSTAGTAFGELLLVRTP